MLLRFDKLSALLQPGYQQWDQAHFAINESMIQRIQLVEEAFQQHTLELLNEVYSSGDMSLISESDLLKRIYALMDELAAPKHLNEVAYCIHLAARMVDAVLPALLANAQRLHNSHTELTLATLFRKPHATA